MEDHQKRVLAYSLAKRIETKLLDKVSGGAAVDSAMCARETLVASGASRQDWDASVDFHIDW